MLNEAQLGSPRLNSTVARVRTGAARASDRLRCAVPYVGATLYRRQDAERAGRRGPGVNVRYVSQLVKAVT